MSTFRTASEPVADSLASAPSVSKDTTQNTVLAEKDNGGLYTYEAINGKPYTVKNFNLDTFWDSPTSEMQDGIKEVDQWIQEQARSRNLQDTAESYKEIVDEILNQIGKSDNEKPESTFERVKTAVEALKRLESAKLPKILNVNSLTPDEYKKTRA